MLLLHFFIETTNSKQKALMLYLGTWSGICAVYLGTCCDDVLDSCSDAVLCEGRGCGNDWSDSHICPDNINTTTTSPSPNLYTSSQVTKGLPPPLGRPTPPTRKEERKKNLSRCPGHCKLLKLPQILTQLCYPCPLSFNFNNL